MTSMEAYELPMLDAYQAFVARCVDGNVLGLRGKVGGLEDVAQGKLWAYGDRRRRLSKRG